MTTHDDDWPNVQLSPLFSALALATARHHNRFTVSDARNLIAGPEGT